MVSDTRSSRKAKDEAEDQNSKKKINVRKDSSVHSPGETNISGVRKSAGETSSSNQTTPSPPTTRKSKRLEQGISPPATRKSERLEKHNTPSPLRTSNRGKKNLSSSSFGPKQASKGYSPSSSKKKKEKPVIQVTMESEKAELETEEVGMKRKKVTARTFRGLFKMQRVLEIETDGNVELEGPDKLSQVGSDNSRFMVSEAMENGGNAQKLSDEDIDKVFDRALPKSTCLNRIHEEIDNDTDKDMDAPELESSASSVRSRDSSVSPEKDVLSPSTKCEYYNLLGPCALCSKSKRVAHDSPEQELCSCRPTVDEDLESISCCKDRSDHGVAVTTESAEKSDCIHLSTKPLADSPLDSHENECDLCNKDGELLLCLGKDCKRCYHPSCLDPPLLWVLPGVWHCSQCVKKKLLFGTHSVSKGVESIWDVREVEVSNAKGVGQRQYLVKYHGLAHVHNHWVSEKQLLLENPSLVSNFIEKDEVKNVRWNKEWTEPHRLLRKRSIQDKIFIASSDLISVCNNEWLVKWYGLSYDDATWELENAHFLSSSLGQNLMKDYETRQQRAKKKINKPQKECVVKLSELPASRSDVNDNYMLQNVNKLRECLSKCKNAVIFDDLEQAMTVILSIGSMTEICWPFLVVTPSTSLSQWEAEFAQLMPSVDIVVYNGKRETRKGIISSEFYDEEGSVMLQVLLSSTEVFFEDIDILRDIRWEAIVIDEYQHTGIAHDLEQIKLLRTDSRILLINGQIKDTTSEYLQILSLLESQGDYDKLRGLTSVTNDNLSKLKDRLSRFVAYGSISQPSKFLEYWVPVHLSNYQLEQYCDTLLSNSIALRSCSAKNLVGALPDVLLTVRKCCDHPYLVDSSLQVRLFAEKRTAAELLEIGIEASGKLQLLDLMLKDIRAQGLQVLILFQQLSTGPKGVSTGDILDDFLRQRFGENSYERVDAGVIPSKKQAAVNRFNKKETGQFAFLLENRACSSVIKLFPVDVIVIYDSDWNPSNDLRALQKISVDSKFEQIKVFRLYSSFTVEEKALVLAKKTLTLINLQNFSRTISHNLLSWGAIYLFSKLDEYHATESNSTLALNSSSGQLLLNEVTKDFQAILSGNRDNNSTSVISKVKLGTGSYRTNMPMFGEPKIQVKDGEEPHVFWSNLLDGKHRHWRNLKEPSPRTRKRTHHFDGSVVNAETQKDDVGKKRRKVVDESSDPTLVRIESGEHQTPEVAVSERGPSTIIACNRSENLQRDVTFNDNPNCLSAQRSFTAEDSTRVSEERIASSNEQKSLCSFLQGEVTKLCQILKLPDDVILMAEIFLDYVTKNHHVNSDSPSILQAFQISLCRTAASIQHQKVDKKDSLMLAKQLLNYQCTEEQVNLVYSKMRLLKKMFVLSSEKTIDLGKNCSLAEEHISKEPSNDNEGYPQLSNSRSTKMDIGGESANEELAEGQTLLQQKKDEASVIEIDRKIKKIQKKCKKWMKKLICKHQEEIKKVHSHWEEKSSKLETDHKLEIALIKSIHGEGSVRTNKIKLLDDSFAKKKEELNLLKDQELNDLQKQQLAEINEEKQKAANWLAEVKSYSSKLGAVNGPESLVSQAEDSVLGLEVVGPTSGELLKDQNPSNNICTQGNDVAPSIASLSTPAEAMRPESPFKNLATANSQSQLERSSEAMAENLDAETVSVEQVPGENQLADQSEEAQAEAPRTVSNENVDHIQPEELSNASNESDEGSKTASPDALVIQKDKPEAACGGLQSPEQQLANSQQTEALPDSPDLVTQKVQDDRVEQTLVSAEPQGRDAPAVENQNQTTSQIEAAALDTVTPMPSNPEGPVTDETLTTPFLSNHEAPVRESNSEQGATLEVHTSDHGAGPMPSNPEGPAPVLSNHEAPVPESNSERGATLEVHTSDHSSGPLHSGAHGQSVEAPTVSQSDLLHIAEQPNQGFLPLGIGAEHLNAQNYLLVYPNQYSTSWSSNPSLLADPLQNELERLGKETVELKKGHDDVVLQLKSDCEKEIHEMITQIRLKYETKCQQSEDEFRLKKNKIDKCHNKVLMNKILAEAFRSKCMDLRPSGLPSVPQGVPSSFMQHLHQALQQPTIRPAAGPSQPTPIRPSTGRPSSLPGPAQQPITTPAPSTMPQLYRSHSQRSSSPITTHNTATPAPIQGVHYASAALRSSSVPAQTVAAAPPVQGVQHSAAAWRSPPLPSQSVASTPPVQAVQHTAALFSGTPYPAPATPSRPPLISAITPSAANPRVGGEFRARAPHLQSSRPPAAMSLPVSQPRPQQILPSQPVQPPLQAVGPLGLRNSALSMNRPDRPSPSPSTPGLLVDTDNRPTLVENRTSSPLPDICSTFHQLELSDFEILGDVQGNQASSPIEKAVVCLSDDD